MGLFRGFTPETPKEIEPRVTVLDPAYSHTNGNTMYIGDGGIGVIPDFFAPELYSDYAHRLFIVSGKIKGKEASFATRHGFGDIQSNADDFFLPDGIFTRPIADVSYWPMHEVVYPEKGPAHESIEAFSVRAIAKAIFRHINGLKEESIRDAKLVEEYWKKEMSPESVAAREAARADFKKNFEKTFEELLKETEEDK